MLQRRAVMAVAVLVVALSGCVRDVTRPPITAVQFFVNASPEKGSPSSPVKLSAHITNAGDTQVWHWEGCSGNGIFLTVLGPDGRPVALEDPRRVGPGCGDFLTPLERRGTLGSATSFTGTLYEQDSRICPTPTYRAPSGTYTVIARFNYTTSGASDQPFVAIERRVTFAWQS